MQDRAASSRTDSLPGTEHQIEHSGDVLPELQERDRFVVYCPETDGIYVVPVDDAPSTGGTLRVSPTANGQAKRIRWASDYRLPE
jgi:PD-(D/E)XK endonuclease